MSDRFHELKIREDLSMGRLNGIGHVPNTFLFIRNGVAQVGA
jgi:hypothetical protein